MITVNTKVDPVQFEISVKVQGHANYGEPGKDIVCAAASILAYGFARNMQVKGKTGLLRVDIKEEEGCLSINVKADLWQSFMFTYGSLSMIRSGYAMLEEMYPEYVKLIVDDTTF